MDRDGLIEMALSLDVWVVNTRFPRPAIIEPSGDEGGALFMPAALTEGDAVLIHDWLTGLRAKSQEVA